MIMNIYCPMMHPIIHLSIHWHTHRHKVRPCTLTHCTCTHSHTHTVTHTHLLPTSTERAFVYPWWNENCDGSCSGCYISPCEQLANCTGGAGKTYPIPHDPVCLCLISGKCKFVHLWQCVCVCWWLLQLIYGTSAFLNQNNGFLLMEIGTGTIFNTHIVHV